MLTYDLTERAGAPLYEYLYRCLRRDILSGKLAAGERLPGRRSFAEHLGVSPVTVDAAYSQLVAEGCVEARPRRGYFVAALALPDAAAEPPPVPGRPEPERRWRLDLRSNRVDASLFPVGTWAKLTRRVLSEDPEALLRSVPHQGLYELREAIAGYLRGYKGLSVRAGQVVLGAGAEFLYLMLAQLFRGAALAVEDPGYPQIRRCYLGSGAECIPVALDAQGVDPRGAPGLRRGGAAHLAGAPVPRPASSRPCRGGRSCCTGPRAMAGISSRTTMTASSPSRPGPCPRSRHRPRGARHIHEHLLADYCAGPCARASSYCRSGLLPLWRERLGFYSSAVPSLEQHVLARFISGGFYERHLARLRKTCRERRVAVLAAFRASAFAGRIDIREPGAGLHFLMRVDTALADEELRARAEARGVRLAFLSDYAARPGGAPEHVLVINYAGLGGEKLGEAVEALEGIIN